MTEQNTPQEQENTSKTSKGLYVSMWRWHFFAGLYCIPFLIMLSVTGLMMMFDPAVQDLADPDKRFVEVIDQALNLENQLHLVESQYGTGSVQKYIPPKSPDRSAQFHISDASGNNLVVYLDQYAGLILGAINPDSTIDSIGNNIHGELFLGSFGDALIEISAGFIFLLIVTGLYLWWPKTSSQWKSAFFPFGAKDRNLYKQLHSSLGMYLSIILIFFVVSGLAWAGIWGGQLIQPWNSFPAEKWDNVPLSDQTHASLNNGKIEDIPWNLELTPLPASGSDEGITGIPQQYQVNLASVDALAKSIGFTGYRIALPKSETGVYTISASTMSGDITDPTQDRTVHVDRYTGKILVDITWDDYSIIAKSMAAGIALHMGYMGTWNLVLNTFICLLIIAMCLLAVIAWWMRKPKRSLSISPPPLPKNVNLWKTVAAFIVIACLWVPLTAAVLIVIVLIDYLLVRALTARPTIAGK